MPAEISHPGVYIQEVTGGVHAIPGVPTSITAFMGRAVCGPLGQADGPVTVFSFQEYQNVFGGLSHDSPMSYAVRDFFVNGGGQAVIVRLFENYSDTSAGNTATFYADAPRADSASGDAAAGGGLRLKAASPGAWGNRLVAQVDLPTPDVRAQVLAEFASYGVRPSDPLFNLTVYYSQPSGPARSERFTDLTVTGDGRNPNRVDKVLAAQSQLVRSAHDYSASDAAGRPAPDYLYPNWSDDWQRFDDELAESNLTQAQLLAALPGPTAQGTPAAADSGVISPNTFGTDGQQALDRVDLFNLLCAPADYANDPQVDATVRETAALLVPYCVRRRAVYLLDPLSRWSDHVKQDRWDQIQPTDYGLSGDVGRNAAVYFPRVVEADPLKGNEPATVAPCGIIAGVIAATDLARGVWKAPAGMDAGLNNIIRLEYDLTNEQNGMLNPLGINCLRTFPVVGSVVWGARTLRGADELQDDYKYLSVRRLALYMEESIYRGTRWAVYEPNDATLWGALRTSVNSFLAGLQRQGAFYSYFVRCDATTTTQADIDQGIVNIMVGVAPVKPAEFVVISIRQQAQQPPPSAGS